MTKNIILFFPFLFDIKSHRRWEMRKEKKKKTNFHICIYLLLCLVCAVVVAAAVDFNAHDELIVRVDFGAMPY